MDATNGKGEGESSAEALAEKVRAHFNAMLGSAWDVALVTAHARAAGVKGTVEVQREPDSRA